MAGVDRDRDREPFRGDSYRGDSYRGDSYRTGDSYRAPSKSSGAKMEPPAFDRYIPSKAQPSSSSSSSPYFANGDRRPPQPAQIDTSRRASAGSGRGSADASPRDVLMTGRYPPPARRTTRDDGDVSRFSRDHSRRESHDRAILSAGGGESSSAGARTPASEVGAIPVAPSPTMLAHSTNGAAPSSADSMAIARLVLQSS
jgi:hypothetical protein